MKDKGSLKQTIALTVLLGAAGLAASEIIRYVNPPVGFFPMIAFIGMYGFSLTEIFLANNISSMVKAYFVDRFIKSYSKKHESAFAIHKQANLEIGKLNSMLLSYHQMPEKTAKQKAAKEQYFLEVQSQQDVYNSVLLSHKSLSEKDKSAFLKFNKYSANLFLLNVTPVQQPQAIKSFIHSKSEVHEKIRMLDSVKSSKQGIYGLGAESLNDASETRANGKVANAIIESAKKQSSKKQKLSVSQVAKDSVKVVKGVSENNATDREL